MGSNTGAGWLGSAFCKQKMYAAHVLTAAGMLPTPSWSGYAGVVCQRNAAVLPEEQDAGQRHHKLLGQDQAQSRL